MADTKITNLTSASASTGDELVVSTTAATDRKVTAVSIANLFGNTTYYEVGTFTPTWTPVTTGTFTIGYAAGTTGNYTRIGNSVRISGIVSVTTLTTGTGTGQMGISNLPFASRADGPSNLNLTQASSTYRSIRYAVLTTAAAIARAFIGPIATTGVTSACNLADLSTGANSFGFAGVYSV